MRPGIKQRFDGFADEVEEAITEAAEGEQKSDSQLSGLQQKAIKQKVVSIVERRLEGDPEDDAGASKAFAAKNAGGSDSPFVTDGDRAAAVKRTGAPESEADDGGAAVSKALSHGNDPQDLKRRAKLLKGTAEPRNQNERLIANATGKKRKRFISMLESQVKGGAGAAVDSYADEREEERREKRDEWMDRQRESVQSPSWE